MQEIILIILFVAAAGFLMVRLRNQYRSKDSACGTGCGCEPGKDMVQAKPKR